MDIHYVHDALGRRIGKLRDGNLEKGWLYADALNPIAQLDNNGNIEATFIYGSRAHVADAMVMADNTVYRFITDHLGSVRLVVNAETGEVVQRMDYDAFGRVLNDTNPGFQPFGFAGGLYDDDTGLVRFGARDYDAYAGRWTAKDPILFDAGANIYEYAFNDPVNFIDATGRIPFRNDSNETVTVWGNPGPGRGSGKQQPISVPPGGQIDAEHPFQTPGGPVTDVDFIDFDRDGKLDPEYYPLGDKIPGDDEGVTVKGVTIPVGCGVIESPFLPPAPVPLPYVPARPFIPVPFLR